MSEIYTDKAGFVELLEPALVAAGADVEALEYRRVDECEFVDIVYVGGWAHPVNVTRSSHRELMAAILRRV